MNLYEKHLVITEKQYKQLKDKILYIKNAFELELIDFSEMLTLKKEQFFNVIENNVKQDTIWLSSLQEDLEQMEDTDIFNFFDKEFRYECEELPLTLEEWLEYEDNEHTIRKIVKEEINELNFYLLILIRYC